jgi:hypothetical protein
LHFLAQPRDDFAILQVPVKPRQALAVCRRAHDLAGKPRPQFLNPRNVILMVMGDEQMGKPPAEPIQFSGNRRPIRGINGGREARFRVMDENRKIVAAADELADDFCAHDFPQYLMLE